jgi:hypothetical protein
MSYKTLKIEVVDCKLVLNRTKIYSRRRGEKTRPREQNFFPRLHFNHWHTYKRILYKTLKLEAVSIGKASVFVMPCLKSIEISQTIRAHPASCGRGIQY